MRGEDSRAAATPVISLGTPPRARGRPSGTRRAQVTTWNTPACAGKTPSPRYRGRATREHPRVRGEDDMHREHPRVRGEEEHPRVRGEDPSLTGPTSGCLGTPPRARGRRSVRPPPTRQPGNTPACAGKTKPASRNRSSCWEHPRVRGEDSCPPIVSRFAMGTPPRARGRHHRLPWNNWHHGNTPACAGKTVDDVADAMSGEEHPRVRGEDRTPA